MNIKKIEALYEKKLKLLEKYNKEYYNDQDLKPSENLFFKISIIPFGGINSPNLK